MRLCPRSDKMLKANPLRVPEMLLVHGKGHISSLYKASDFIVAGVYNPDLKVLKFAYGDMHGTPDALLFVLKDVQSIDGRLTEGAQLEIFVAKNMSHYSKGIWAYVKGGRQELLDEMANLRAIAKKEVYAE